MSQSAHTAGLHPDTTAHDKRPPACRPPEFLFQRRFNCGTWRGNNFSTGPFPTGNTPPIHPASAGVFSRLRELMGGPFDSGTNDFAMEHGRRMVYVVRCVASGMDEGRARALRNLLVSQAPDAWAGSNGTTLEYAGCCLSEKVVGGEKYLAQSK